VRNGDSDGFWHELSPACRVNSAPTIFSVGYQRASASVSALIEAPFAVYQTDQERESRLFATGLHRDQLEWRPLKTG
jgi:hypothetical protein